MEKKLHRWELQKNWKWPCWYQPQCTGVQDKTWPCRQGWTFYKDERVSFASGDSNYKHRHCWRKFIAANSSIRQISLVAQTLYRGSLQCVGKAYNALPLLRCLQCGRPGFSPWVAKILWRRKWQPTPVLLPGKSHGCRSLVGYSPRGRKELDMTERLNTAQKSITYSTTLRS